MLRVRGTRFVEAAALFRSRTGSERGGGGGGSATGGKLATRHGVSSRGRHYKREVLPRKVMLGVAGRNTKGAPAWSFTALGTMRREAWPRTSFPVSRANTPRRSKTLREIARTTASNISCEKHPGLYFTHANRIHARRSFEMYRPSFQRARVSRKRGRKGYQDLEIRPFSKRGLMFNLTRSLSLNWRRLILLTRCWIYIIRNKSLGLKLLPPHGKCQDTIFRTEHVAMFAHSTVAEQNRVSRIGSKLWIRSLDGIYKWISMDGIVIFEYFGTYFPINGNL